MSGEVRLERILVGLDFSEPSFAAACWASHELAPEAAIRLVHVIDLPEPPAFLRGLYPSRDRLLGFLREDVERRLEQTAREVANARLPHDVQFEIREGRSHDQLATAANEWDADLIAVGEHGQRPGIYRMLGSTAERLIRVTSLPVLLARAGTGGRPRHVLVPIDDTDLAETVLRWGLLLARRFDAKLTVFHALHPKVIVHVGLVSSRQRTRNVAKEIEDSTRIWMQGLVEQAAGDSEDINIVVAFGEPRYEILAAAKRYDSDLIVMGSRGAGGVTRVLLGSVATAVARGAASPVLVVTERVDVDVAAEAEPREAGGGVGA